MKVLFVSSNDFGELSLATFFARNQKFNSVFVVPEHRADYFDELVGIMYAYASVSDLPRIIENESPDIISLNSAYLMMNGNLATMDEFRSFIIYLKNLGCPLMTTDPFVRVFDSYPDCSFQMHGQPLQSLKDEMTFISDYISDFYHIYGFPSVVNQVKACSFYNDSYCIEEKDREPEPDRKDRWLFVLGELDAGLLLARYGETFYEALAERLIEVCRNRNNIVQCVFPKDIVNVLRQHLTKFKNLEVLNYMTLKEFEKRICNSDAVFYWNIFSNSILLCYYYNIPFLCFGKGHIAELNADLFNHMADNIYRKSSPEFIDFFSPVESHLGALLRQQFSVDNRQVIVNEYRALPTPQNIVENIFND